MGLERLWVVVLTILLRSGYVLIHVGCIPTTNVNNIYTQYIFNFGSTTLVFILFGSSLTLGEDWKGLLGTKWITEDDYYDAVTSWSLLIHSASIVQLVTAGRVHLMGELITTVLYSGLIYPLVVHSAWTLDGWMRTSTVISEITYEDVGGGSVVHLFGGGFAFAAMAVFGGRVINVNKLDHNSVSINAQSTSTLGYFIVIASTIGLMMHSPHIPEENLATAQINCLIGAATGFVITTLFYFPMAKQSYWTTLWILQGGLASLVTLASGVGTYTPAMSFTYAFLGVSIYLIFSLLVRTSGLEDYCNIISIHMIQGLIGSILIAFNYDIVESNPPRISSKMLWQILCSGMLFIFGALCSATLYIILMCLRILRNKDEQEIHKDTSGFERGCCPMMRRALDPSSGHLFPPGYHTFIKFRRRPTDSDPNDTSEANQSTILQDTLQEPTV